MCSHEMAFPSVNCTIVPTFHPQWKFPCWKWPHISPVNISEKNATVFLACFASTKEQKVAMIFILCVCVCCKPIFMGFYVQQKEFFCPSILSFFLKTLQQDPEVHQRKETRSTFSRGVAYDKATRKTLTSPCEGDRNRTATRPRGAPLSVCPRDLSHQWGTHFVFNEIGVSRVRNPEAMFKVTMCSWHLSIYSHCLLLELQGRTWQS